MKELLIKMKNRKLEVVTENPWLNSDSDSPQDDLKIMRRECDQEALELFQKYKGDQNIKQDSKELIVNCLSVAFHLKKIAQREIDPIKSTLLVDTALTKIKPKNQKNSEFQLVD